jgi:hypothetical protein
MPNVPPSSFLLLPQFYVLNGSEESEEAVVADLPERAGAMRNTMMTLAEDAENHM